jgi:hypothetical protein
MSTRIPGLSKYQGRNPDGCFRSLDGPTRQRAYHWLGVFLKRWGRDLPRWRFAILVGQARRLALRPPTSAWGRSMLARRGGRAVQRRYRHEGRHPTASATRAHVANARVRRAGAGQPERLRHGFTVGNEP